MLLLKTDLLRAQTDDIGSGRALQLEGVDDYISLGNVYDDLQFPITISAWVFVDQSVTNWAPVFVTQDNAPLYNGFWFIVQPTRISIGYGDGLGENDPAFRRSKTAEFPNISNRWTHITGIIRGAVDMDLFVNGINVGGSYSGFTDNPMSNTATDIAKIGYWFSNSQSFYFKGKLDEVRLWNKALTEKEIRDDMCVTQSGDEAGLIGYWNFNELNGTTLFDKSVRSHSGTLIGNPTRVFSGAPMGETSLNTYRTDWNNFSFEIEDGENKLVASNVKNSPEGIHLYKVSSSPSQTAGLSTSLSNRPYFGVFLASLDNNNNFDASYLFEGKTLCKAYTRNDNSSASWVSDVVPVKNKLERSEFIKDLGTAFTLNLGNDINTCTNQDIVLDTRISNPDVSFLWSTGQSTSSIKVNSPGKYWVKAENSCGVVADTLMINLLLPPPSFSLGDDQTLCEFDPIVLKPYANSAGYQFTWQDNSTGDSFLVKNFGVYSVKVKNECGEFNDMITFSPTTYELPELTNVITPNGDLHNEYFVVAEDDNDYGQIELLIVNRWGKQVYFSDNYKNDWNGGELSNGVYFYTLYGTCINETKGSLSIVR